VTVACPTVVAAWTAFLALGILPSSAAQTPETAEPVRLSLGVSIGTSVFSGAARGIGDGGEQLLFLPYRPTIFGVGIGYGGNALRLEGTAGVGAAGLAIRGAEAPDEMGNQGLLIVIENAFRVRAFSGGASVRLGRLRGGPVLRASGAALVESWTSPGTPARTVVGIQAGLAMEVELTRSLAARAEGTLGFSPASPFRQRDLPEGFRQSGTWRRSLGVGVSWRP
jgi:hypothetical protein